ncbi:hypothetical protein JW877_05995 [bacterium]|nr:hypothetical protein [bacterium]
MKDHNKFVTYLILLIVFSPLTLLFSDSIRLLGRYTTGPAFGLFKADSTVFVAAGGALVSIDVSDPANPVLLDTYDCGDMTDQPDMEGDLLVTAANIYRYYLINVSNPSRLDCLWWHESLEDPPYNGDEWQFMGHLRIRDSMVFIPGHAGYNFFRIEDLHCPSAPIVFYEDTLPPGAYNPHALALSSKYAFVADVGNNLWIYDIDPPESTHFLFCHTVTGGGITMPGIEIFNDSLLCVSNSPGIFAFSIKDLPDSLIPLWFFPDESPYDYTYAWDCWVDDSLVFMANQEFIRMGKILDDSVLTLSVIPIQGWCCDLIADNGFLYTAQTEGGLVIYDYSSPDTLQTVSGLDLGEATRDIVALGDSFLVTRLNDGLVYFVPEAGSVRKSKQYIFGPYVMDRIDTAVVDDRIILCVTAGDDGFFILSVDEDSIRVLHHYTEITAYSALGILADGCSLWVGAKSLFWWKLQLFDVSNPSAPIGLGEWDLPNNVERIVKLDDRLYVLTWSGLTVFQKGDSLVKLGYYGGLADLIGASRCTSLQLAATDSNIFAYISHFGWLGNFNGLYTFDVTNPMDTILLVDKDTIVFVDWPVYGHAAVNLRLKGTFLCFYDNTGGWYMFTLSEPSDPDTITGAYWQHNGNGNGYGLWFDPPFIYSCTGDDGFYWLEWDTSFFCNPASRKSSTNFFIKAYPNPFNSEARFDVPYLSNVEIYNLDGKLVEVFSPDGRAHDKSAIRTICWRPAENCATGLYLVRASNSTTSLFTKVLYIK